MHSPAAIKIDEVAGFHTNLTGGPFELNEPQLHVPSHIGIKPLHLMTEEERETFERDDGAFGIWPEVGSRAMQRVLVAGTDAYVEQWLAVQNGNYRFCTSQTNGLTVKFVLR